MRSTATLSSCARAKWPLFPATFAALCTSAGGEARHATDLCCTHISDRRLRTSGAHRRAAEICEAERAAGEGAAGPARVSLDHIQAAISDLFSADHIELMQDASLHQKSARISSNCTALLAHCARCAFCRILLISLVRESKSANTEALEVERVTSACLLRARHLAQACL
jgi:hypothetical protein